MPINVTRLEAGIYHSNWTGSISTEDGFNANTELTAMAKEAGDERLITIIDLTHCTNIPFDFQNLRNLADRESRTVGFVAVKASRLATVMGKMIDRVSSKQIKFAESLDAGVIIARELLSVNERA